MAQCVFYQLPHERYVPGLQSVWVDAKVSKFAGFLTTRSAVSLPAKPPRLWLFAVRQAKVPDSEAAKAGGA